MKNYLNFEVDIKDLEKELDELKDPYNNTGLSEVETDKISKFHTKMLIKKYLISVVRS